MAYIVEHLIGLADRLPGHLARRRTYAEIAEAENCSQRTVYKWLGRLGLPTPGKLIALDRRQTVRSLRRAGVTWPAVAHQVGVSPSQAKIDADTIRYTADIEALIVCQCVEAGHPPRCWWCNTIDHDGATRPTRVTASTSLAAEPWYCSSCIDTTNTRPASLFDQTKAARLIGPRHDLQPLDADTYGTAGRADIGENRRGGPSGRYEEESG